MSSLLLDQPPLVPSRVHGISSAITLLGMLFPIHHPLPPSSSSSASPPDPPHPFLCPFPQPRWPTPCPASPAIITIILLLRRALNLLLLFFINPIPPLKQLPCPPLPPPSSPSLLLLPLPPPYHRHPCLPPAQIRTQDSLCAPR